MSRLQPIMEGDGKGAVDLRKHIQQVLAVHNSRCTQGATPRHYVAFVNLCGSLYFKKRSQLLEQQDFLKVMSSCLLLLYHMEALIDHELLLYHAWRHIVFFSSLPSIIAGLCCPSVLFVSRGHAKPALKSSGC